MARPRVDAATRFWTHVDRRGADECWPWIDRVEPNGYVRFRPDPVGPRQGAHVFSFLLAGGILPNGWTVDHLCHDPEECNLGVDCLHRRCMNPVHLAARTAQENVLRGNGPAAINARKTHCPQGHPLDGVNLVININGARVCRTCQREANRRYARNR